MYKVFSLIKYDCKAHFISNSNWLQPLLFMIILSSIFAFSFDTVLEPKAYAGVVFWLGNVLAVLLSLNTFLRAEDWQGTLSQYAFSPLPLWLFCFIKCLVHWIVTCLPLVLAAPLLALSFDLELNAAFIATLSLLVGSFSLSFIGLVAATLVLRLESANLLLCLLLLPLYVPIILFGAGIINMYFIGLSIIPLLVLLLGISVMSLGICPLLMSYVLKVGMS